MAAMHRNNARHRAAAAAAGPQRQQQQPVTQRLQAYVTKVYTASG